MESRLCILRESDRGSGMQIEISTSELFTIIGQLYVAKLKREQQIEALQATIEIERGSEEEELKELQEE